MKTVLNAKFEARITYGAKDLVNSSLNYAYAILYGVVQRYLFEAGLSLNISFLHTPHKLKPTLSYDMIEEFRAFVVDRTIVAMINKAEPIKLGKDGLLDASSRQLIAKNIKEKLGSYTKWHKQNHKIENIIAHQCHALAHAVFDGEKYHPFIGKY